MKTKIESRLAIEDYPLDKNCVGLGSGWLCVDAHGADAGRCKGGEKSFVPPKRGRAVQWRCWRRGCRRCYCCCWSVGVDVAAPEAYEEAFWVETGGSDAEVVMAEAGGPRASIVFVLRFGVLMTGGNGNDNWGATRAEMSAQALPITLRCAATASVQLRLVATPVKPFARNLACTHQRLSRKRLAPQLGHCQMLMALLYNHHVAFYQTYASPPPLLHCCDVFAQRFRLARRTASGLRWKRAGGPSTRLPRSPFSAPCRLLRVGNKCSTYSAKETYLSFCFVAMACHNCWLTVWCKQNRPFHMLGIA